MNALFTMITSMLTGMTTAVNNSWHMFADTSAGGSVMPWIVGFAYYIPLDLATALAAFCLVPVCTMTLKFTMWVIQLVRG